MGGGERDLLVLALRLSDGAFGGSAGGVDVELRRGGETFVHLAVDCRELALASDLESVTFTYSEPPVRLPAELVEALTVLAGEPAREPLWLEFPAPAGLLAILPWERLLGEVDGCRERPVLRLPYHRLPTTPAAAGPRRVVLCGSSPAAKEAIPLPKVLSVLAARLVDTLPPGSEVHLFPQATVQADGGRDDVSERLAEWLRGASARVQEAVWLHDPRQLARDEALGEPSAGSVAAARTPPASRSPEADAGPSPWLAWISRVLGGRPADAVHFVAHGYRNGSSGGLALSQSPVLDTDRRWARFVWAPELAAFLNQVGAATVGLTAPQPNFSILGLRLLADQLARLRPGPVLLDEGHGPGEPRLGPLAAAWWLLLGPGVGDLEAGELRLQAHPERLGRAGWGESARDVSFGAPRRGQERPRSSPPPAAPRTATRRPASRRPRRSPAGEPAAPRRGLGAAGPGASSGGEDPAERGAPAEGGAGGGARGGGREGGPRDGDARHGGARKGGARRGRPRRGDFLEREADFEEGPERSVAEGGESPERGWAAADAASRRTSEGEAVADAPGTVTGGTAGADLSVGSETLEEALLDLSVAELRFLRSAPSDADASADPRWLRAGHRLVEQVRSGSADVASSADVSGAGRALAAARHEGITEALALFAGLMADDGEEKP